MVYIWVILIGVLVWVLLKEDKYIHISKKKNATEMLNERLARGEIDIKEYQEIKKVLKEGER